MVFRVRGANRPKLRYMRLKLRYIGLKMRYMRLMLRHIRPMVRYIRPMLSYIKLMLRYTGRSEITGTHATQVRSRYKDCLSTTTLD